MISGDAAGFGALLCGYRAGAGLTQEELAGRAGLSVQGISALESGERLHPRRDTVLLLAEALGLSGEDRARLQGAARRGGVTPADVEPGAASPAAPPPGNLPAPPTPLVGREREVTAVRHLLLCPHVRLLTLTGSGGIGKTRVALRVAAAVLAEFGDGAWFVGLAPIVDPDLVASAVAQALGVAPAGGQPAAQALAEYLRPRRLLLVLDNCEQVLGAAPLIAALLAASPGLKVLATSRAPLRLYGEHEYPVPPLALPDPRRLPEPGALARYEAVQLFVERAQAVEPGFAVTDENAPTVAEICHRLDGLPLAIELAAARTRLLPSRAMLRRLGNRLALLTGGARDLPERQRTIRNTIDWSYGLLGADERRLFARLGVFAGGCMLEAAESVCALGGERDVLAGVAALVEHSLLRREEGPGGEAQLAMLETIHEYARERLDASGEAEDLRRRHAEYYTGLAEAAEPELRGHNQSAWLDRLEAEYPNLRAALSSSLEPGRSGVGLRLASALERFWYAHSRAAEGVRWLNELLAAGGAQPPEVRAKALGSATWLSIYQSDYSAARPLAEGALSLYRELGDDGGAARTLNSLGSIAMYRGEYGRAEALYGESVALHRRSGDGRGLANALNNLGNMAMDRGEHARARALHEESLRLRRELGDTWEIAVSLNNLGLIALYEEQYDQAVALHEESVARFRELGDKDGAAFATGNLGFAALYRGEYGPAAALLEESLAQFRELGDKEGVAYCLEGLAGLAAVQRRAACAARLWGAAAALRERLGAPLPAVDRAKYERYMQAARAQIAEAEWAAAWAAGRALPLEDAVALALAAPAAAGTPPPAPPRPAPPSARPRGTSPALLTAREREVAALIARGLTNRQIAAALFIGERTVDTHAVHLLRKLNFTTRAQVAVWASEQDLQPADRD